MEHKTKKKGFLGLATALAPVSATLLSNGDYVHGAILSAVVVGLFIAYDHYDDKAKGQPKLPEGITPELIEELTENIAADIERRRQSK